MQQKPSGQKKKTLVRTECLRLVYDPNLLARKRAREDDMNDYVCTGEGHTLRMLFALVTRVHKEDSKTIGTRDNKHTSERQKTERSRVWHFIIRNILCTN